MSVGLPPRIVDPALLKDLKQVSSPSAILPCLIPPNRPITEASPPSLP